ncbi:MAG: hypothetical protein ACRDJF_03735 [Actinomycetota bacterium]
MATLFAEETAGELAAVASLTKCLFRAGTTGRSSDFGNSFSKPFTVPIGLGFRRDCVSVLLMGWDLDFARADHQLNQIKVRIGGVSYNPANGGVSFTVSDNYLDENGDDGFNREAFFGIVAVG